MQLSQYLEENGLSYKQLSEQLGVTETSIYRYAKGLRKPRAEHIKRIFDVTEGKVTADDFYETAPSEPAPAEGISGGGAL